MKTAKELCAENQEIVDMNKKKSTERYAQVVIDMLSKAIRGNQKLSITFSDKLTLGSDSDNTIGNEKIGYVPMSRYDIQKLHSFIKVKECDRIVGMLLGMPEVVNLLTELGYKVTFDEKTEVLYKEQIPVYNIVPETITFFGKVIPAHPTLVRFDYRDIVETLRSVTITACCGEE